MIGHSQSPGLARCGEPLHESGHSLVVTVDTEEEGLWSGQFRRRGNTVRNIEGIPRFQQLCSSYGIHPTYLVDTPVVEDTRAVAILREHHTHGACEIGSHLHPWCAPPLVEETGGAQSYMCNLSEDLQRRKLTRLTESIEHAFGRRPTSFRAGRYGLDIRGARILADLGYVCDSSVINFTDYSDRGGPDFWAAPTQPYWIGGEHLCQPSNRGVLLEVPVTVGFNRRRFSWASRVVGAARKPFVRRLRLTGVLDRTGLIRRIKFSPEQSSARRMNQLVDACLANGSPVMVMMLHSSSLVPGMSPYAPDSSALEAVYARLEATFDYCRNAQKMTGRTLTGFAERWAGHAPRNARTARHA